MSLPVPTGTVTAAVNGISGFSIGPVTLDSNGNAVLTGTVTGGPLNPGNYAGDVTYSGDSNYPPNQWNYNFTAGGATTMSGTAAYNETTNTLTITVAVTAAS